MLKVILSSQIGNKATWRDATAIFTEINRVKTMQDINKALV